MSNKAEFHPNKIPTLLTGSAIILALLLGLAFFGRETTPWAAQGRAIFGAAQLLDSEAVCLLPGHTFARSGFLLLLGAGLLTGLSHCVGMCGPLVGAFALRRRSARQAVSTPLVLYQLGRLTTYLLLGGLAGGLGAVLNLAAWLRGWQSLLAVALGLLMVLLGLGLVGWLPTRRWLESPRLARLVGRQVQALLDSDHPLAPLGLGLANGLLPCGAVYAMTVLAAGSGGPLRGALLLLIFGLGTLPAMLGVGLSVSSLSLRLRRGLFQVAAWLVVLVGLQLLLRGLALGQLVPHTALGGVMLW